jgi:hypothetical protein
MAVPRNRPLSGEAACEACLPGGEAPQRECGGGARPRLPHVFVDYCLDDLRRMGPADPSENEDAPCALVNFIMSGDLAALQWLEGRHHLPALLDEGLRRLAGGCCEYQNCEGERSCGTLSDTAECAEKFRQMATPLREEFEQWQFHLSRDFPHLGAEGQHDALLWWACAQGRFEILPWFLAKFALAGDDRTVCGLEAILSACWVGQLRAARGVADLFDLTAEASRRWVGHNLHTRLDQALAVACERGHLEVAQWLVEHFELAVSSVRWTDAVARSRDHPLVARWLLDRFGPTAADYRPGTFTRY